MAYSTRADVNATWVNRLRWFAILGQVATIGAAMLLTHVQLPLRDLALVLLVEAAFGGAAEWATRHGRLTSGPALLAWMSGDIVILTALLFLAGGPENPFNFLYLVHVTLGLVVAGEAGAWFLAALSSALFGVLFFWHRPLQLDGVDAQSAMGLHMQGMWVGFVVASVSIVAFMSRLTRAVRERESELASAVERMRNAEKLASLATLAAGAAHELNTPLSTIALAARELELSASEAGTPGAEMLDDALLIRSEIERCRSILEQLSVDAGHASGDGSEEISLWDVLAGCPEIDSDRVTVDVAPDVRACILVVPPRPVRLAFSAVAQNALASEAAHLIVRANFEDGALVVTFEDDGPGMPPAVLERAFEPFFTTRPTGKGMGLGLFLARSVAESIGGSLEIDSSIGAGTRAKFVVPFPGTEPL